MSFSVGWVIPRVDHQAVFHDAIGRVKCGPMINKWNNPANRLKGVFLCVYFLPISNQIKLLGLMGGGGGLK